MKLRPIHRTPRITNMLLNGPGAETLQDRGSLMRGAVTINPHYNPNTIARCQEYLRWYATAWEARKIIDIPVDDALRKKVTILGLDKEDTLRLENACAKYNLDAQIRRALIQERLLGGCVIFPILMRDVTEKTSDPLYMRTIQKNDLLALNVIDITRITRVNFDNDPFSPTFDKAQAYIVNGATVHASRLCILDGAPLFGPSGNSYIEMRGINPSGFGDSKLAPLYDLLNRMVGTQQGAFHLVNLASCLLVEAENLRSLNASQSPAVSKLQEIVEQISLYRGAVIDAKGVKISQHAATFGSVPELVMTFAQLLSAASDIPATRFLGQAPGGLNATGDGDRENYYDMVASYQRLRVMPVHLRLMEWIGASVWGWKEWAARSGDIAVEYPPLKTMSEREESEIKEIRAKMVQGLYGAKLIRREAAVAELAALGVVGEGVLEDGELDGEPDEEPDIKALPDTEVQFENNVVFKEEDHPRDADGKFASAGGSGGAKQEARPDAGQEKPEDGVDGKDDGASSGSDKPAMSLDAIRSEVTGKIAEYAPKAARFTLGILDGVAESSGEFTSMISNVLSGLVYSMTGGAAGSGAGYDYLENVVKQLRTMPWKALTGELSEDVRKAFHQALWDLDHAEGERATGKALAKFLEVLSGIFGPEFAAKRLAVPPGMADLPKEIKVKKADGKKHIVKPQSDYDMYMGGGIQKQGIPFEVGKIKELQQQSPSIVALPKNFKTFDAFDPTTGTAYSIKTLDTITGSRLMKPRQLYSTLKKYIDDMVTFDGKGKNATGLDVSKIKNRNLELALPATTTNGQLREIVQAIQYARQQGIEVNLTFVR